MQPEICIIGMGVGGLDGLTVKTLTTIQQAELVIGHQRHLGLFPEHAGEKIPLGKLTDLVELLQATTKRSVVLASGDPLYFGVGRFLLQRLPKERIKVISNISSVQYAFAMIKEPWDDALVVSVHGRPLDEVVKRIAAADKVCILTDHRNNPASIAQALLEHGVADRYTAWVCSDLGLPTEACACTDLPGLLELPPAELMILILMQKPEETA